MADGIKDMDVIRTLKSKLDKPIVFNQIAGGKSPAWSLTELRDAGVSLVNYSKPCLFAAQTALEDEMKRLREKDGFLQKERVGVQECTALLNKNMVARRKSLRN